jgi:hypothetical protein
VGERARTEEREGERQCGRRRERDRDRVSADGGEKGIETARVRTKESEREGERETPVSVDGTVSWMSFIPSTHAD